MTTDNAGSLPVLALAGAAILQRLTQLEDQLARYPRVPRDAALAAALAGIRQEAGDLLELYEYVTQPGLCANCGATDVPLPAALCDDPGREVCEACQLDPDVRTFPLAALADDREVLVITRGDLAWLAGRAVTDCEAARLAAAIGDTTAGTVARLVQSVCGLTA